MRRATSESCPFRNRAWPVLTVESSIVLVQHAKEHFPHHVPLKNPEAYLEVGEWLLERFGCAGVSRIDGMASHWTAGRWVSIRENGDIMVAFTHVQEAIEFKMRWG